ncbi:MAG TPA: HEAT repeat domain-containing protein [Gemmatimonadales bacterium]|nr:HEAT repeat domain-containing protein [Gemmatimonadales bacterium]
MAAALLAVSPLAAQQTVPIDEAAVGELARLLAASDSRTFSEALLRDGLQQTDATIRRQAALAAGRIGDTAAVPMLLQALADSDQSVRSAAAFALGMLKDPRAVQPLLDLIQRVTPDQQDFGTFEAVTAIAKIGGGEGARALQLVIDAGRPGQSNQAVSRALLESWRLGTGAPVLSLTRYAQDPDNLVRWNAVFSLARLGDARGVPYLLTALNDQDATVRAAALRGITARVLDQARQPHPPVIGRVRGLLTDPATGVRVNALRALGTFHDTTLSSAVAPLASDGVVGVAVAAETTLGVTGGAAAIVALRAHLVSANFAVRRQAAIGLAEADSAAGVAFADSLAANPDWHWRSVAAEAEGAARDRGRLERLLADPDGRVVASALNALMRIIPEGDPAFLVKARGLLTQADPAVRSLAADAVGRHPAVGDVDALVAAYQRSSGDPFNDARLSAVRALCAIASSGPAGENAVSARFFGAVSRPADYLAWRMAAANYPGPIPAWPQAPPIATGKTDADYRDAARRYLYPSLHGMANPTVTIETDRGAITVELLPADAPLTVAAFLALVDRRYFDGDHWHRVVPDFVIQDGDPRDDGWGGPGFALRDEISPRRYQKGSVGLALSGPDTGGSQYFITLEQEPRLDGTYPIFGRVTSDLSVLDNVTQGDRIRSVHR